MTDFDSSGFQLLLHSFDGEGAVDPETWSPEKQHIKQVLAQEPNLERAADILGITSVTLWRKRKIYGFV